MNTKRLISSIAVGGSVVAAIAAAAVEAPVILAVAVAVGAGAGLVAIFADGERAAPSDAESPPSAPCCERCGSTSDLASGIKDFEFFPELAPSELHICEECFKAFYGEKVKKYYAAINAQDGVETFPVTYRGKVHMRSAPKRNLVTGVFRSQEDALKSLRVMASFHGFDGVDQYEFKRDKRSEGNYVHSVWQASGIAFLRD